MIAASAAANSDTLRAVSEAESAEDRAPQMVAESVSRSSGLQTMANSRTASIGSFTSENVRRHCASVRCFSHRRRRSQGNERSASSGVALRTGKRKTR